MKKSYDRKKTVYAVIVIVSSVTLVIILLNFFNIQKELLAPIITSIVSLCGILLPSFLEEDSEKIKEFNEAKVKIYRNTSLVVMKTYFLHLLATYVFVLYNIGFFTIIFGNIELPEDFDGRSIGLQAGLLVSIYTIPFTFFITKYASHRIKKLSLVWVTGAFLLAKFSALIISFSLGAGEFLDSNDYAINVGLTIIHFGALVLGHVWAEKTQKDYIVRTALKQVDSINKDKLVEIVLKNPSRWKTTNRPHKKSK